MEMRTEPVTEIIDITRKTPYEKYLYRCLGSLPFRRYRKRHEYLLGAMLKGFHKKLLTFDGEVVGQVEYAPATASAYPILGDGIIVMNCIWVLRRVKGRNFGKLLLRDIMNSEGNAIGFATIGLDDHWSPWMKREQMERLGFKPVRKIGVRHRTKHIDRYFNIHLMWLQVARAANLPTWDEQKLLEGVDFCLAHPLYHPERLELKEMFEKC